MTQATLEKLPFNNSNLFSAYYLSERLRDRAEWDCDDEAREALDDLTDLYELEEDLLPGYKEDALIDSWIDEVLDILGYGTNVETTLPEGDGYVDVLLFEDTQTRRDAAGVYLDTKDTTDLFEGGLSLLEAKQWDADFSKRFSENRPYYNASQQIRRYLDKTPSNIEWGILTNGRKWRLYGTKDHEAQIYYEVDLPELIEDGNLNRFKYFYLFFRPEAFRTTSGSTFLDSVWSESETATQELGDDLQDNVFRALRILGHGIVETNDLDIDPDDDEKLSELKEQSLVLLYRLMFVLYAESRQLIDPEGKQAQKEYEQNFSLNQHRLNIHDTIGEVDTGFEDEYSTYSTSIWSNLQDLFRLVDQGKESLGIPPYNGGLFDHDDHAFLTEHKVSDRHLAEVIYRLSTTENDEGRYVLADYGDLDTRHLGSVYEGLLEHQFRIAPEDYAAVAEDGGQVWKPATEVTVADAVETVEKGSLYVTNDEGERKATGAYYTPDYVVNYIVEETIEPLVDDIREDLVDQGFETGTQEYLGAFLRRVTQLKILDPAMGSGHFLTGATGYLAEQVMKEVREVEVEMGVAFNEQHVRREIAKECIYGVDINGMAVELAKLSMWLETLAADRPLAFLDHHLKTGNSLVGSDITEVLSDDSADAGGQLTLSQSFARARQQTLGHVMDLMADLLAIDNEKLADIKSMEELYDEIRDDPLYQRLFEVANVHTAQQFGVDVPDGVYEVMAGAIDDADKWAEVRGKDWFASAQALAGQQSFFHWELEFPEVFFDEDGEKLSGAGFDAVIGNPPYVRQEQLQQVKPYLESTFEAYQGVADLYVYFVEQATRTLRPNGRLGYIISNKFMRADYGRGIRDYLLSKTDIQSIVDFGELPVFEDASTFPAVVVLENSGSTTDVEVAKIKSLDFDTLHREVDRISYVTSGGALSSDGWSLATEEKVEIVRKMEDAGEPLEEYVGRIHYGIKTGYNDAFFISSDKKEAFVSTNPQCKHLIQPLVIGDDIRRYHIRSTDRFVIVIPAGWTNKQGEFANETEAWDWFSSAYPQLSHHLSQFEQQAADRYDMGDYWWELRECDYYDAFQQTKLIYPIIQKEPRFTIDTNERYPNDKCFVIPKEDYYVLSLLNSNLLFELMKLKVSVLGDEDAGGRLELRSVHLKNVPIYPISEDQTVSEDDVADVVRQQVDGNEVEMDGKDLVQTYDEEFIRALLTELSQVMKEKHETHHQLNLRLLDHLGSYADGPTLVDIGLTQPPSGSANSILQKTATEKPNLRVGEASVKRESDNTVEIQLTARYKPSEDDDLDENGFETDQWGYTETDLQPALRITDLTETDADLIEAFVPVAVDEAGGFADFRETATKTNSLVDRLRKLTLPALSDVEAGLESYTQTKERAEELETKIERTDELIDDIVYELYGLT